MAKKLAPTAIRQMLSKLQGWKLKGSKIVKSYKFSNFVGAMAFVNHVAIEAEKIDHHPDVLIHYDHVTLTLSTHSAGGLTSLDFVLAQKIDG